jgi:hypothetical protein
MNKAILIAGVLGVYLLIKNKPAMASQQQRAGGLAVRPQPTMNRNNDLWAKLGMTGIAAALNNPKTSSARTVGGFGRYNPMTPQEQQAWGFATPDLPIPVDSEGLPYQYVPGIDESILDARDARALNVGRNAVLDRMDAWAQRGAPLTDYAAEYDSTASNVSSAIASQSAFAEASDGFMSLFA